MLFAALLLALAQEPVTLIRAGRVVPVSGPPIVRGAILVRGSKIERVGLEAGMAAPPGAAVVDLPEAWALPGFVDLHSHIGGGDINDMVLPLNPELRVLECVQPENENLKDARAGGVTTILFIPGSGTNLSGFGALLKTAGATVEEMLVRFPGALKIAQAGNPERGGGDIGSGRIGMNWMIRQLLDEGRRYTEAWDAWEAGRSREKPAVNLRLENFRGLFHRKFPVAVHSQIFQVVQSTLRILAGEYRLWTILNHSEFDGFLNAPEAVALGVWVVSGPRGFHFDRRSGRFIGLAAEWHQRGIEAPGINTDAPVVPQEELTCQAAMAVRFGLPEEQALKGITIHPARAVGIDARVGTLEAGKDADVVLWTGWPLDPRSRVLRTMIDGKWVYDPTRERRRF